MLTGARAPEHAVQEKRRGMAGEASRQAGALGRQASCGGKGDPGSHRRPALAIPPKLGAESLLSLMPPMPLCHQSCLSLNLDVPHGGGDGEPKVSIFPWVQCRGQEKPV